ncbi:neuferricin isoform X2 [Osmia bicornis bicornis]|uniref:neuferricin isoform X2 n=1 Tax=Osmia bicornis bicornis TaxID=1437191 RepID=UPI001EAF37E5|nr:neuferricin isoform X2 [Osmia bicornis bicornis]
MMVFKYVWLLPLFVSVYLLYSNDYLNDIRLDSVEKWLNIVKNAYTNMNKNSNLVLDVNHKMFTSDELRKYTNLKDGRDGSLAFITGQFDDNGLTDDISSLSMEQIKALNDWVQFYNETYIYKGKLIGRYYNEDGVPTEEFYNIQQILIEAKEKQFEEEHKKRMFPPCNIEWKPDSGTVVWCSKKSGGIERDWIGVPRMLFESPSSKQYRCACVKLDSKEYEESKGMLKEYTKCPKTAIKCALQTNDL